MNKQDIPSLTGLRFLAAMAIVVDHTWPVIFKFEALAIVNVAVHQLAYVGMSLFFVLSGFIIHYNYGDDIAQKGGLWRFFVARFSRLYPLYLVILAVDFFVRNPPLDWMALRMLTATQSWTYEFDAGRFIPYGYLYSVVSWSISTEIFFYLVYPLVAKAVSKIDPLVALAILFPLFTVIFWYLSAHPLPFDKNG